MEKSNLALIATTIITVAGTIAVAIINKPDPATPKPIPPIEREVVPPAPDPDDRQPAEKVKSAPERNASVDRTPEPDQPVVPPVLDVSGAWHDAQHAIYYIAQQGGAIRISSPQYPAGIGGGTVIGNAVQWDYRDNNGTPGRCAGMASGPQIAVVCTAMGVSYAFPMHRPDSG